MPPHHKTITWIITSEISLLLTRKQRSVATEGNHNNALAKSFPLPFLEGSGQKASITSYDCASLQTLAVAWKRSSLFWDVSIHS